MPLRWMVEPLIWGIIAFKEGIAGEIIYDAAPSAQLSTPQLNR